MRIPSTVFLLSASMRATHFEIHGALGRQFEERHEKLLGGRTL